MGDSKLNNGKELQRLFKSVKKEMAQTYNNVSPSINGILIDSSNAEAGYDALINFIFNESSNLKFNNVVSFGRNKLISEKDDDDDYDDDGDDDDGDDDEETPINSSKNIPIFQLHSVQCNLRKEDHCVNKLVERPFTSASVGQLHFYYPDYKILNNEKEREETKDVTQEFLEDIKS